MQGTGLNLATLTSELWNLFFGVEFYGILKGVDWLVFLEPTFDLHSINLDNGNLLQVRRGLEDEWGLKRGAEMSF